MSGPWRSGWCGLGAQAWQHARCSGSAQRFGDGRAAVLVCSCECHAHVEGVAELVERHDLGGLVVELDALIAAGGVIPPAVARLRSAAREVAGGQSL